jgi:hypothetical protein
VAGQLGIVDLPVLADVAYAFGHLDVTIEPSPGPNRGTARTRCSSMAPPGMRPADASALFPGQGQGPAPVGGHEAGALGGCSEEESMDTAVDDEMGPSPGREDAQDSEIPSRARSERHWSRS